MSGILGRFLRDRRAKVTVADAGLPPRRSGRTATLTQEDLARLTGFSIRAISALEQGASHRPSRALLDAVSRALRLSPEERQTLWQLATHSAAPEDGYVPQPEPYLRRMNDLLDPHPSYVCDALYNVQSHNRAFAEWVVDFSAQPPDRRNLARYLVLDPHARHILPNWREDLRGLIARIRAVHAVLLDNRELDSLITDLLADPDFSHTWQTETDVAGYSSNTVLVFREPGFTDPEQPDDPRHHIPLVMTALTPVTPNDGRRFVTLLLPEKYRRPGPGSPCAACQRAVSLGAGRPRPAPAGA
jgi:transcriptional regulator with XRE-family HTH domain